MTVERHDTNAFTLQREIFLREKQGEVNALRDEIKDLAVRFVSIFSEDPAAEKIKNHIESGNLEVGIQGLRTLRLPLNMPGTYSKESNDIRWEIIEAHGFVHDAESTQWKYLDANDRQKRLEWAKQKVGVIFNFVKRFDPALPPIQKKSP